MQHLLMLAILKIKEIAEKLGLIADYVVEGGTYGLIHWKKWNNGDVEAFFESVTHEFTLMANGFMGGYLYYKDIDSLPDWLFTKIESIHVTGYLGTGVGWGCGVAFSPTHIRLYIVGNQNSTQGTVTGCTLKGRWK